MQGVSASAFAATSDPDLQCFSQGCQNVGTGYCLRTNNICRGKGLKAGCRRRYCQLHKYEKQMVVHQKDRGTSYHIMQCCLECGPEMEADINKNRKSAALCICGIVFIYIIIAFAPLIILVNK